MESFQRGFFEFLTLIVGLAIVAVLVSQSANTSSVVQAFGTMIAQLLGAATAPVTGGTKNGQ